MDYLYSETIPAIANTNEEGIPIAKNGVNNKRLQVQGSVLFSVYTKAKQDALNKANTIFSDIHALFCLCPAPFVRALD